MTQDEFSDRCSIEPFSGCWLWTRATRSGYGQASISGVRIYAHRLALILYRGFIPERMNVLHRCDTPLCVNPDHLFLGTHSDNMRDRDRKGKQPIGERNGRAKLTIEQVSEIRSSQDSTRKLGRKYGVSSHQISCIKRGKRWKIEIALNQ